ncbi:MAG: hypothetical protein L0027_15410 [Candidatus Rokubacteria bacterium]|nr:hypothetical protein [Candidatus Rokubacteria bacterium]
MRSAPIAATVLLVLVASLALAPAEALADRFRGGGSRAGGFAGRMGGFKGHGFPAKHGFPGHHFAPKHGFRGHGFWPKHGFHRPFHKPFVRPFFPGVIWATPFISSGYLGGGYAPPVYYEGSSTYNVFYSPPASYAPPVSYAPAAPRVVEFPTGRYELHGDGFSSPYTWVWVPNPPPAPPTAPPSSAPVPEAAPAPQRAPSQLYRWMDAEGVMHWTDRLDAVPPQYRPKTRQVRSL